MPVNKHLQEEILRSYCQVLADLERPQQIRQFLGDSLSREELLLCAKRFAIAMYLDRNRSYDNIAQNLDVTPGEIFQVAQNINRPGIQLALKDIKAEQWANYWSRKISQTITAFGLK